jgi:hypothetical protein
VTQGGHEAQRRVAAILLACVIRGFAPVLYRQIAEAPALEIMAHRALWTAVPLGGIAALHGRPREVGVLVSGPDRKSASGAARPSSRGTKCSVRRRVAPWKGAGRRGVDPPFAEAHPVRQQAKPVTRHVQHRG